MDKCEEIFFSSLTHSFVHELYITLTKHIWAILDGSMRTLFVGAVNQIRSMSHYPEKRRSSLHPWAVDDSYVCSALTAVECMVCTRFRQFTNITFYVGYCACYTRAHMVWYTLEWKDTVDNRFITRVELSIEGNAWTIVEGGSEL